MGTHPKRGEWAKILVPFVHPLQLLLCCTYTHVVNDDVALVIREIYSVGDNPFGIFHKLGIFWIEVTFLVRTASTFCIADQIGEILYEL